MMMRAAHFTVLPVSADPVDLSSRPSLRQFAFAFSTRQAGVHEGACAQSRHFLPTANTDGWAGAQLPSLLPPVAMVTAAAATALVTYRQILGERLHTNDGDVHHQRLFSPVVSCLPTLLDDEHLYAAFMLIWQQQFASATVSAVRPALSLSPKGGVEFVPQIH